MRRCSIVADGRVLVANAWIARHSVDRARGMLGRSFDETLSALVLEPCRAIHTFGMRMPIDAVFYDRDRRVLRIVEELRPLRGASCAGARGVIEAPARQARSFGFDEAQRIEFATP